VPSVALEVGATAAAVPLIRHLVADFAARHGATLELESRIAAAISEAVANVVTHAYPHGMGTLTCDCDIEDGTLEVVIADQGQGILAGEAPGLGMGLAIISELADGFRLWRGDELGVSVWMRFDLG
jgi:anti-sigma regulatory factor (Ser/Thr protein kinase)